jgi:hypothetical protein
MGIIYKLTSPCDKYYIGQHKTDDVKKRIDSHAAGFKAYKAKLEELKILQEENPDIKINIDIRKGCVALYRAFDKYGIKNFEYEILHDNVPLDKLNELEDEYILKYNTLAPNGYNLRINGANGQSHTLSGETRKKFSEAAVLKNKKYLEKYRRYKDEMKDMPQYVSYYQDSDGYRGYKISKHPLCYSKSFTSKTKSLDELKKNCLEFLKSLGEEKYVKKERNLPVGICKPKKRNGYMAYFKVNGKRTCSYFNNSSDDEENLQEAIEWLDNNRPK